MTVWHEPVKIDPVATKSHAVATSIACAAVTSSLPSSQRSETDNQGEQTPKAISGSYDMVGAAGLEPATIGLKGRCYYQLS